MATTSGTVGLTVIDVTTLIEHAFRRCGKQPSTVSGEQQLMALENLFLLCTDLVNEGISLWCIEKRVTPLVQGQAVYIMPPGTADILSLNYRTLAVLEYASTISGVDYVGWVFEEDTSPSNVAISFAASGTPALVVESSPDGVTWTQVAAFARQQTTVPAGTYIAQDIDNSVARTHWRARDTSGTMLATPAQSWSNTPSEIPMSSLNRDDYWNLPNKTFQANSSLQYWYDKQIQPQVWLWPVPSTNNQIVAQIHRQIQDVGSFTNLLEAPSRWYQYMIYGLSELLCSEIPPGEVPPGRLEWLNVKAVEHKNSAADSESDGAPLKLAPNLSGYTRG